MAGLAFRKYISTIKDRTYMKMYITSMMSAKLMKKAARWNLIIADNRHPNVQPRSATHSKQNKLKRRSSKSRNFLSVKRCVFAQASTMG
jgi:hypothetical protein